MARSQARRILFGLDQFKCIVLDFKDVAGIGQGFADEIFRVFQNAHPDISFEVVNANESVQFMIARSKKAMTN
ncbi:MAG: STAS-like domain-containing protein [Candidatus Omnitrophica bacterium]|nr:STAS-like domain-containing protein [Candidatus Omnitrophota bacterium]